MNWINDILKGFASLTLFPNTDYADFYHHSDTEIIADAWQRTGDDLRIAIQEYNRMFPTSMSGRKENTMSDKELSEFINKTVKEAYRRGYEDGRGDALWEVQEERERETKLQEPWEA